MGTKRAPVYYFSHGGPSFMYEDDPRGDAGAYRTIQKIGKHITTEIKPSAIVIFSAHWQSSPIKVNIDPNPPLLYDFSNYPKYMYEETYPNVGSPELAQKILQLLANRGIEAQGVNQPVDHGVWCSFKVAFPPETNPLNVPIVQVSIYENEDADKHFELGQALAPLRDEGVIIIGSGMTVHNLLERYDYGREPAEYSITFDSALQEVLLRNVGEKRKKALAAILAREDARNAHPTFEHLLPMHVAAGAAFSDQAECLYTNQVGSFAWGQYKFG